jgi:hypothetical protein
MYASVITPIMVQARPAGGHGSTGAVARGVADISY